MLKLPYIRGIAERIRDIMKKHEFRTVFTMGRKAKDDHRVTLKVQKREWAWTMGIWQNIKQRATQRSTGKGPKSSHQRNRGCKAKQEKDWN